MPRALLHLPEKHFDGFHATNRGFYGRVHELLSARGWQVDVARRRSIHFVDRPGAADLHLVHQGLIEAPGVLNTGLSYLPDYWYADRAGIFGDSSIARLAFDPETIPQAWADGFVRRLRARFVDRRISKHPQPGAAQEFAPGAVVVFLQGPSLPVERTRHMGETVMLRAILETVPANVPVLVKPHPRNADPGTMTALAALSEQHPNLNRVDAHVHDLLRHARVACSLSSGACFEALMFGVPALVFGRTDFAHCAEEVRRPEDVPEALRRAEATDWPYNRFLFWFLRQQCVGLHHDDWSVTLFRRIEAVLR